MTYLLRHYALIIQIFSQSSDDLYLLFCRQACNCGLDNAAHADFVDRNKTVVVHIREGSHDELAIHPVGHTSVTWDTVAKVLDLEGSLETRRKEASKGCNEGCEGSEDGDMELYRRDHESPLNLRPSWQVIWHRFEDRIGLALQAGPKVCAQVIDGTSEVAVLHEQVGQSKAEKYRADPGTDKSFHGLFG